MIFKKLNGWQRLWVVAAVIYSIGLCWYFVENRLYKGDYDEASWREYIDSYSPHLRPLIRTGDLFLSDWPKVGRSYWPSVFPEFEAIKEKSNKEDLELDEEGFFGTFPDGSTYVVEVAQDPVGSIYSIYAKAKAGISHQDAKRFALETRAIVTTEIQKVALLKVGCLFIFWLATSVGMYLGAWGAYLIGRWIYLGFQPRQ